MCGKGRRVTCVVDGDTVWIAGEKIRLRAIDAPEPSGDCFKERDLAARSAERLRQLLSSGSVRIERYGKDRYGRTLADFFVGSTDVAAVMVAEGLARPWTGSRESWC